MSSLAPARAVSAPGRVLGQLRPSRAWLIVAFLFSLVLVTPPLYLAQTGNALTTGYTIQRLRAERTAWQVRNQQLELELAKTRSLAWVESEAITRLGMHRPPEQTVIRVDVAPPKPAVEGRTSKTADRTVRSTSPGQPAAAAPQLSFAPQPSWLERVRAILAELIVGR